MTNAFISFYKYTDTSFDDDGNEFGFEYWLVAKVYVPLEERGQGKAREMMVKALEEMKAEDSSLEVKLWCEAQDEDTDQELLAEFYESFGFEATGNEAEMALEF